MTQANSCSFCGPGSLVVANNDQAVAVRDPHPVSPGDTLVVPRRHVADRWGATRPERAAIVALLRACKEDLDRQFSPAGYNVGINIRAAAGRTVFHLRRDATAPREVAAGLPLWSGRRNTVPLDEQQRRAALHLIDAAA